MPTLGHSDPPVEQTLPGAGPERTTVVSAHAERSPREGVDWTIKWGLGFRVQRLRLIGKTMKRTLGLYKALYGSGFVHAAGFVISCCWRQAGKPLVRYS